MSDPGFHEVQLSGKQLVFLFMSAIVLLVVTFLLGVDVGRGVRTAVGDTGVSAQAEPPPTKVPDDAATGTEAAKPAEPELSYHDMLVAAAPGDKTPPAQAPRPSVETPPNATSIPTPTPTPAPAPPVTRVQTPASLATPAPPKAGSSDWFIQTGAYSTQAVAEGQVAKLKQLSVPAFVVVPEASAAVKLFRVRIGPYTDRAEAEQVSSRVARQGFTPSITR